MKIAIINNIYPPEQRGGAEVVVKGIVDMLSDAGHSVVVIAGTSGEERIQDEGRVRIYRLRPRNIYFYTDAKNHNALVRLVWNFYGMFNYPLARRVRRILEKEKPDVVHTHNLIGLSFLIPAQIRALGLAHVHTVHDVQLVEPSAIIIKSFENTWRYRGLPTRIYSAILRYLMGSPNVVISPSKFLRSFYSARGFFRKSQFEMLRNPITLKAMWRGRKPDTNVFRFLYLGQVEEHKGIMTLIEAFRILSGEVSSGVELIVVGAGSLEERARQMANSLNIKFLGYKKRDELADIFSTVDVTVVPSLCYENSPTVIFESRLSGVPIIASDIEGVAELIENDDSGWLFKAGDAVDLAVKMRTVFSLRETLHRKRIVPPAPSSNNDFHINLLSFYRSAGNK
ncbi:MAG TPA: glycosyltransferase family 4 protein [Candidatus Magasanikbacteria bacterium]|nr:glycosyltransferase family 4 protein [Candidatus Magasanikbacteria bacterium]